MAEQRQRTSWVDERAQTSMQEFDREWEEKERAQQMEESKKALADKIEKLKKEAMDAYLQYGEHDPTTEVLMDMLEMTLEIQTTIDQINSFMTVMSCVGEMTTYINSALAYCDQVKSHGNEQKHGFFARLKSKSQSKKMRKNLVGGIKQLTSNMFGMMETVQEMREEFGRLNEDMKKMRYKLAIKRQKAAAKRAKAGETPDTPSSARAKALVEAMIANKNAGGNGDMPTPTAPTAPTAPTTAGGTDNIDDIV